MPSFRRIRQLFLIILLPTLVIIYLITAKRATQGTPFYTRTLANIQQARYEKDVTNAMANAGDAEAAKKVKDRSPMGQDRINDAKAAQEAGAGHPEDTLKERLRLAEVAAKISAEEKWNGVRIAAEKASRNAAEDADPKPEEVKAPPDGAHEKGTGDDAGTKQETPDTAAKAADTVAKIIHEVKRSVEDEVALEHEGKKSLAPKEVEKSKEKVEALVSEVSPDKKEAAELQRQILLAREREKESLEAEYRQQVKKREFERQRLAGKRLKAVDPKFKGKQELQRQASAAAAAAAKAKSKAKAYAARTSKAAPPVPTTPAEEEFHRLLALSPVTIFSKSYCPYSLKAKRILTQAFDITPRPYIVELDQHEMGEQLQALLLSKTQRRTVPNIIIAGKSIGGGDEVESLWEKGKLRKTIKDLGGRRIVGVMENEDILKKGWSH